MEKIRFNVTVAEVVAGYENRPEDREVTAMNGKLCLRPAYQREFVYNIDQQREVVKSVLEDFDLGLMYYVKRPDGVYDMLDGQQRTTSICEFVSGAFAIEIEGVGTRYYGDLSRVQREQINEYKLDICEIITDDDSEILKYYSRLNNVGEKKNEQELRSAVYTGPWLSDAQRFFNVDGRANKVCNAVYPVTTVDVKAQKLLEFAIKMMIRHEGYEGKIGDEQIKTYMIEHQHDENADEMIGYFKDVFNWVLHDGIRLDSEKVYKDKLVKKRVKISQLGDGIASLYDEYKDKSFDSTEVATLVREIATEEDVGTIGYKYIIPYALAHVTKSDKVDELYKRVVVSKDLSKARQFPWLMRYRKHKEQNGICPECRKQGIFTEYTIEEMHGDHIVPYSKGGRTEYSNLQMLCARHNLEKSDK